MAGHMKLLSTRRRLGIAAMSAGLVAAAVTTPAAYAAAAPCQVRNAGTGAQYGGATAVAKAIATAGAGDTVEVSGTCAANVTVTEDITLLGKGKRATLDGKTKGRVLEIEGATAMLRDLVVRGGKTDAAGGGILVTTDSAATLIGVEVSANTAGENSFGGGIHAGPRAHLLLVASSVEGNTAGSSGGIDSDEAVVSLHNSKVTDNHATHAPSPTGESCAFGTPATIYACAGGIWNFLGTLVLIDSTVSHNTAGYRGGGLRADAFVDDTTGTLLDGSTILGGGTTIDTNSAGDQGGGIWARVRQSESRQPVDPSVAFLVSDDSGSITDPLTGTPVPAWTGSVTGNTPDQYSGWASRHSRWGPTPAERRSADASARAGAPALAQPAGRITRRGTRTSIGPSTKELLSPGGARRLRRRGSRRETVESLAPGSDEAGVREFGLP